MVKGSWFRAIVVKVSRLRVNDYGRREILLLHLW